MSAKASVGRWPLGDHIAGLVHVDNDHCKRLLTSVGWTEVNVIDDHELWVGNL